VPSENVSGKRPNPADRAHRVCQLIDLYGALLTERQLEFLRLHYEEDMSFGEIARDQDISRQAVHDAVKHGEEALEDIHGKLGLDPDRTPARELSPRGLEGEKSSSGESSAPAPKAVEGLAPIVEALEAVHGKLQRSGGVVYNADGLTREVGEILGKLKRLC